MRFKHIQFNRFAAVAIAAVLSALSVTGCGDTESAGNTESADASKSDTAELKDFSVGYCRLQVICCSL